jgi:hypothetical protein
MAHSGKRRDSLAFSATPDHRGPNREMASCGGFSGKSACFGVWTELWPGGSWERSRMNTARTRIEFFRFRVRSVFHPWLSCRPWALQQPGTTGGKTLQDGARVPKCSDAFGTLALRCNTLATNNLRRTVERECQNEAGQGGNFFSAKDCFCPVALREEVGGAVSDTSLSARAMRSPGAAHREIAVSDTFPPFAGGLWRGSP